MADRRRNIIAVVAAAAVLLLVFFSWRLVSNSGSSQVVSDPNTLPGMQTGPSPWSPEIENLLARLQALKLPALSEEGNALHIHQHLDIFVNGSPVAVPAGIGINQSARFISPIHTHNPTGVIHVESDEVRDFTLGQFFDIWGVRFTRDCIGGYCKKGNAALKVYSHGKPVAGDPRVLVLGSLQEIAVVYGPPNSIPSVPSSYRFEPGS